MILKEITVNEVRQMTEKQGLVLQGCGGDSQEWIDGINKLLTEQGILLDGDTFKEVSCFEHGGRTNLIFHMDDVKLDAGRLAIWRIQSHGQFEGTWLSDYLRSLRNDGPTRERNMEKPECSLIGADGNIFNLMGLAARTLKDNGMAEAAKEMSSRVTESGSYDAALCVIMDYVTPVESSGQEQGGYDMRMR